MRSAIALYAITIFLVTGCQSSEDILGSWKYTSKSESGSSQTTCTFTKNKSETCEDELRVDEYNATLKFTRTFEWMIDDGNMIEKSIGAAVKSLTINGEEVGPSHEIYKILEAKIKSENVPGKTTTMKYEISKNTLRFFDNGKWVTWDRI